MHTQSQACTKCREIYESLRQHFMQEHAGDMSGSGAILNNILLNVLALTSSLQSGQTKEASSAAPSLGAVNNMLSADASRQTVVKPTQGLPASLALESLSVSEAGSVCSSQVLGLASPSRSQSGQGAEKVEDFRTASSKEASHMLESVVIQRAQSTDHLPGVALPNSRSISFPLAMPNFDEMEKQSRSASAALDSLSMINVNDPAVRNMVGNASLPGNQGSNLKVTAAVDIPQLVPNGVSNLSVAQLIAPDGVLTPAAISFLLANPNMKDFRTVSGGQVSGKSDLDVADILVNKMPIPSLNRGMDPSLLHLSTLYLRQLAFNQQQQLQQQQQHVDLHQPQQSQSFMSPVSQKADMAVNLVEPFGKEGQQFVSRQAGDSAASQFNELSSLISSVTSKDLSSVASTNDTMEQLIARHKQISNLIDFLTKKSKASQAIGAGLQGHASGSADAFDFSAPSAVVGGIQVHRQACVDQVTTDSRQYDGAQRDATTNFMQGSPFVFGNFQVLNPLGVESRQPPLKPNVPQQGPLQNTQQQRSHPARLIESVRTPTSESNGIAVSLQYPSMSSSSVPLRPAPLVTSTLEHGAVNGGLQPTSSLSQNNHYLASLVPVPPVVATAKHLNTSVVGCASNATVTVSNQEKGLQHFLTWASNFSAADYHIAHSMLGNEPSTGLPVDGDAMQVPLTMASVSGGASVSSACDNISSHHRMYSLLKPMSNDPEVSVSSSASGDLTSAIRFAKSPAYRVGGGIDAPSDPKSMLLSLQSLISRTISGPVMHSSGEVSEVDMQKDSSSDPGIEEDQKRHFSVASMVPLPQYGAGKGEDETEPRSLFRCKVCSVTFGVLSTLHAHEKTHLGEQVYECNFCYETFRSCDEYEKHIAGHRGEESILRCTFCPKIFTSRGDFNKHVIEHTQRRPYCCSHCQKAFRDPGSLVKHERIHTGERPYKCEECQRAFAEYSSLRKHLRTHSGEKPYKCSSCSKAFSISGNLQRHMFIHTGQRPYKCTLCAKAFNNPSHLRRHIKNLHGEADAKAMVAAAASAAGVSVEMHGDDDDDADDAEMQDAGDEDDNDLSDDVAVHIIRPDKGVGKLEQI